METETASQETDETNQQHVDFTQGDVCGNKQFVIFKEKQAGEAGWCSGARTTVTRVEMRTK